jgi:hypothetical protein
MGEQGKTGFGVFEEDRNSLGYCEDKISWENRKRTGGHEVPGRGHDSSVILYSILLTVCKVFKYWGFLVYSMNKAGCRRKLYISSVSAAS